MKTELLKSRFCQNYESLKMEKWVLDEQICRGFDVKRNKEPEIVPIQAPLLLRSTLNVPLVGKFILWLLSSTTCKTWLRPLKSCLSQTEAVIHSVWCEGTGPLVPPSPGGMELFWFSSKLACTSWSTKSHIREATTSSLAATVDLTYIVSHHAGQR